MFSQISRCRISQHAPYLKLRQLKRTHMIAFPHRPSITERYSNLGAIKESVLPPQRHTTQSIPLTVFDDYHKEELINKPDGSTIFITDKLPEKYKKALLSEEEIEFIMRGGPDV